MGEVTIRVLEVALRDIDIINKKPFNKKEDFAKFLDTKISKI
ncbi:MAG: hypothetical protein Q8N99_08985 [Nanoarchaeota archaeon]|nr:hypothetical protein [Nanoarchaeota archaeon]